MSHPVVYLDNNATTAVAPEVFDEIRPYLTDLYGNPSSMHTFGGQVGAKMKEAREKLASLIGAHPAEVVYTSCGTESDNAALRSAVGTNPQKKHIVISKVEHPAVLNVGRFLKERGYSLTELSVDARGRINLDELRSAINENTAIVSVMWANNEIGNVYPVLQIGEICREKGVLFHTDAVQAVGKVPINLNELPIDFLSLSGHKLHAPKGVGALYVRRSVKFEPFMIGGHQENGRRAGTENVAGIIALGKAAELAEAKMNEENTRVRALRDRLEQAVLKSCPDCMVNGDPEHRLPNTSNISFSYIEGEAILLNLDMYGIAASSGSACTSGSLEPSHVLRAMGVPFTAAHGSVRFSFSVYNTDKDVDAVIKVMPGIVKKLRAMSPFGPDNPYFTETLNDTCSPSKHKHCEK